MTDLWRGLRSLLSRISILRGARRRLRQWLYNRREEIVHTRELRDLSRGRMGARDRHRTLLKTLVEQFHGEVIESQGDAAVVLRAT